MSTPEPGHGAAGPLPPKPRYADSLYRIHLDMHSPEWHDSILRDFDARQIVSTVAETGCRAMVVFAKDTYGNAYYDTKIGHKHRAIATGGPAGDRDLLAEFLGEAARHGIAMAAYFSAIWDNRACEEHPEWVMRGPDGREIADTVTTDDGPKWRSVCHNSGYVDLAGAMLTEIAERYAVDAFHLDMFNMDFGGLSCFCDSCRRLFHEETGLELPTSPSSEPVWLQFLEFRYRSVERFMRRLRNAIKRVRPDVPVVMNYHGAPGFDWRTGQQPVRHSAPSDLGTGETYTPLFGPLYPGLDTRFITDLIPGRPVEVVSWRMNRITDYTTKPREQLRWELFSSLCLGARVMLIDQPFHTGWLDPSPYRELKRIFGEIEEKRPYLGGVPQRHVGLYYSCKTRDIYARDRQESFQLPVMGAYKACVESHLDVGFIFDETVSAEGLRPYPVVFLPNVAVVTDEEAAILTAYVREGGTIVATGGTSLVDPGGAWRADFGLAEALGLTFTSTLDMDASYVRNLPGSFGADLDPDGYILIPGMIQQVTPRTARPLGDLHPTFHKREVPECFFSHSMHPPGERIQAAAYVNAYGAGQVIYVPAPVDAAYAGEHETPEHRKIIRNAVRAAGFVPAVEVSAPLSVESAVLRRDGELLVHLLAFNPIRQSVALPSLNRPIRPSLRMEEAPIYRARVTFNVPVANVRAFNATTQVRRQGAAVELQVEDVHEILIAELA